MLALMSSGLNGQSFCFNGYLPQKSDARTKAIREFEAESRKNSRTQIFIEAPYRNDALLSDLISTLSPKTFLCVARDLTGKDEFVKTAECSRWKNEKITLNNHPVIFMFLA